MIYLRNRGKLLEEHKIIWTLLERLLAIVLVVEDDPIIAKTIRIVLGATDHRIEICHQMECGLDCLTKLPVDVLVTDVSFPGGSGLELMQKARELLPAIKVLVMSGDTASLEAAKHDGADRTMEKPFASGDMVDAIEALLGEST